MTLSKPHVKLNTSIQNNGLTPLKFHYGFGQEEDNSEEPEDKNYTLMASTFRGYLENFILNHERRIQERNPNISIPNHIDYIKIEFFDQFDIAKFLQGWYNEFGLLGINFSKFNTEGIFAVNKQNGLQVFLSQIKGFIEREGAGILTSNYSKKVIYIKKFELLTTEDILKHETHHRLLNIRLVDFQLDAEPVQRIYNSLIEYLNENNIEFKYNERSNNLEVYNILEDNTIEIVKNFDIVLSVTSSLSSIVRPTNFNILERSYGFEINNPNDILPIVGILDTGISNQTPLASILIDDDSFNLTTSSSFIDNANSNLGHGTSVAALTALGRTPYQTDYRGRINADARLLSLKILDNNSGFLSESDVLELLNSAKIKYPNIKLFVLTTCYSNPKKTNEDFSTYSFALDTFAHENKCLIFICTGNNNNAANRNNSYNLSYFFDEETNICSPAESMNNIVVGSAADSLRVGDFLGISLAKEYPTIYTRKSSHDLELLPGRKNNTHYFKPDVIECGGDFEQSGFFIGEGERASMKILSANPGFAFHTGVGTSFSTPLVANIAAKIQKSYPTLNAQTIKALIVNSASLDLIRFENDHQGLIKKLAGNGIVNPDSSLLSNNNSITFIVEDYLEPEFVKVIPLNFPKYLTEEQLGKSRGILMITATLAFSFSPVLNNHLSYCPIHMAFSFFKNHSGDDILKPDKQLKSKIKSALSWSQNGRFKAKPIPYSNCQKITFPVNVDELLNERNTFKLAVHCRISSQLISERDRYLNTSHPFSIVIKVEETLKANNLTNKLYNGMLDVNSVISIVNIEPDANIDAEI